MLDKIYVTIRKEIEYSEEKKLIVPFKIQSSRKHTKTTRNDQHTTTKFLNKLKYLHFASRINMVCIVLADNK